MIFEFAHHMALLPALVLVVRRVRRLSWWLLAAVFLVSWVADTAVDFGANADLVGNLYPVSQAALVATVLLERDDAFSVVAFVGLAAVVAVLIRGPLGTDVLIRSVSWLSIAGIVYHRPTPARLALLVSFGIGWLAWLGYAAWPGWNSWLCYQGVRAVGIGLFCWSSVRASSSSE